MRASRAQEHLQRGGPVLVLAPLVLALHDDAGGQVRQADRAGGLVDVLAPGAAGTEDVLADVLVPGRRCSTVVVDLGRDVHRGEAGLPLALGVERADSDQAVDAGLALEVAVGHRAAHGDRRAVDARLLVVLAVEQLDVVVVLLGPGDVHPQEHLGPVVGVGAAVAGIDGEDGRVGVERAAQQGLDLELVDAPLRADRVPAAPRPRSPSSSSAISIIAPRSSAGLDRLLQRLGQRP